MKNVDHPQFNSHLKKDVLDGISYIWLPSSIIEKLVEDVENPDLNSWTIEILGTDYLILEIIVGRDGAFGRIECYHIDKSKGYRDETSKETN